MGKHIIFLLRKVDVDMHTHTPNMIFFSIISSAHINKILNVKDELRNSTQRENELSVLYTIRQQKCKNE